jgi:hypothetical protein
VSEEPPGDDVEQAYARGVKRGEDERRDDGVPAACHHQIERQVAQRIEVALCAGGEEILLQPSGEQLERRVVVVVEEVPVDILARKQRPRRGERRRREERRKKPERGRHHG